MKARRMPIPILAKGRYRAVEAQDAADVARAMSLRARSFPVDRAGGDAWDASFRHVLVEDAATGEALAAFRMATLAPHEAARSCTGTTYDLSGLSRRPGPFVEVGRFCLHPERRDADALRLALAALTRIVDAAGAEMLFGCASFRGTDWRAHAPALARLHDRHLAPPAWRPRATAPRTVPLARATESGAPGPAAMPPLLRSYLGMGGRVSDHAVIDEAMDTLHVFTGIDVGAIPAARRRLLRATAG